LTNAKRRINLGILFNGISTFCFIFSLVLLGSGEEDFSALLMVFAVLLFVTAIPFLITGIVGRVKERRQADRKQQMENKAE
jgi:hypothetical protein